MKTCILNLLNATSDNQELKTRIQELFDRYASSIKADAQFIQHLETIVLEKQTLDDFQSKYFSDLKNVFPKAYFQSKGHNISSIFIGDLFKDLEPINQLMLEGTRDQINTAIGSAKLFYTASFYYNEKDNNTALNDEQFKKIILPQIELRFDQALGNITIRINRLNHVSNLNPSEDKPIRFKYQNLIDCGPSQWNTQIENVISLIDDHKIDKLALARTKTLHIKDKSDAIAKIITGPQNHYIVIFSNCPETDFVSLTPERLFKIEDNNIEIDVIAGTIARSENQIEDERLANQLIQDPKNIIEHQLVNESIKNIMLENHFLASQEKYLTILKQKHVQHIYSLISCPIKENTKISDLIQMLHPTPAVGISPKTNSLISIFEIEKFNRNHYAAPIGIISTDFVDIAVGIRSIQFIQDTGIMYAGAGIVKRSNGAEEWKETENKFKTIFHKISQDFGPTSTLKV